MAHVETKRVGKGGTWRAEVGPMLPGDRPRPLRFWYEVVLSLECLVFSEVGDCEAQRINGDQLVGDSGLEDENEICSI